MTSCTLVTGGTASEREAAIAARIDPGISTAVLLEGAHGGRHPLADATKWPRVRIDTIAPGCPCCDAGLVMRVMLDRILRRKPTRLFISLAQPEHLQHLQDYLSAMPYAALVALSAPVHCELAQSVDSSTARPPRADPV